jgi:hypothetical protein
MQENETENIMPARCQNRRKRTLSRNFMNILVFNLSCKVEVCFATAVTSEIFILVSKGGVCFKGKLIKTTEGNAFVSFNTRNSFLVKSMSPTEQDIKRFAFIQWKNFCDVSLNLKLLFSSRSHMKFEE